MIAGRLRECLKRLRWGAADLAEELDYPPSEVARWLDGSAQVPLAVAAWLEALVKAHKALPPPGLAQSGSVLLAWPMERLAVLSSATDTTKHEASKGIVLRPSYPRRQAVAGNRRAGGMAAQSKGASDNETRPL